MNEEEKKAIEFVEDLISWSVELDLYPKKEECEKLETILNLIKKLQEENKELNNRCKNLDEEAQAYVEELMGDSTLKDRIINRLNKENEELKEINNELEAEKNEAIRRYNFETIPIKKVKDKIEELNNNRQYLSQFKDYKEKDYTNEEVVNNCVEVLQELLESEE